MAFPLTAAAQPADPGAAAEAAREELGQRLALDLPDDVVAFYRARDRAPLWTAGGQLSPAAHEALAMLQDAGADGLDPAAYDAERLTQLFADAEAGDPRVLTEAELRLSIALAAYAVDLRKGAKLDFTDPSLAYRAPMPSQVLKTLAEAPSLSEGLAGLQRQNPIYEKLRAALAQARADGDTAHERVLLANLNRVRALPVDLGERYILVDAASSRLWLYDKGEVVTSMKVVVGKASMPTPLMAGVIRNAVFMPYWNVPEDLVRTSIAPRVLKQGLGYLQDEQMEVFAGYEDDAPTLDPAEVDWAAVARGTRTVRVRQLPGPKNMMGAVKLDFRNPLGIFLHDTPLKELFDNDVRTASSGCVRLEDAMALARLLFDDQPPEVGEGPEQRIDLPKPVPVYIAYFTALPTDDGVDYHPDVYDRDKAAPTIAAQVGGR